MHNMRKKANKQKIIASQFMADKVSIFGPKVDGSFKIAFEVGEYQYDNIKNLPKLNGKMLAVAVVPGSEIERKQKEGKVSKKVKTDEQLAKPDLAGLIEEDPEDDK